MKNIKTIIVSIFLAVVMHSFSLNLTPEKDNTEFQKTFFEALRKKMLGEYTDAVNLFVKCINSHNRKIMAKCYPLLGVV